MAFKLDFETEEIEGITITVDQKDGDAFLNNYKNFGWYLYLKKERPVYNDEGERYKDTNLYDYILYRDKNLPNIDKLKKLENNFQAKKDKINMRKESFVGLGDKLNTDYIDFFDSKPLMKEFKFPTWQKVVYTILIPCGGLGVFLWLYSLSKVKENKKVEEYENIKKECAKILEEAKTLL